MRCDIPALLAYAHDEGASDLHLSSGLPPMLRIRGTLIRLQMDPLPAAYVSEALREMISEEQRRHFENHRELDFGFEVQGVTRVRASLFAQSRGESGAFRLIPNKIRTLDELNMPPVLKELASRDKGLVVVTGPTGAGKSTTLAALVDYVNETRTAHIITIEDPIEYMHESKKCLVSQREVGTHTQSFASALRVGLREDPDILLVGELRDLETIQLAITAAETGHLVFATLHTTSAARTVDRMIHVFAADQQSHIRTMLSDSIEGVIAQTLLSSKDGRDRVAAVEVLVGVPALRNLIREEKTSQIPSLLQTGAQWGMQTLDQSLLDLVKQGLITRQEARNRAWNPHLFEIAGVASGTPAAPGAAAAPTGRQNRPSIATTGATDTNPQRDTGGSR
jgi:twitching motility protein PilT